MKLTILKGVTTVARDDGMCKHNKRWRTSAPAGVSIINDMAAEAAWCVRHDAVGGVP